MDYPHSDPKVGLHGGKFTDGAADGSYPPSLDSASWACAVTDEIKAVIAAAGLVPTEGNNTQLAAAIAALIAASAATGLKALAYLDAGQGLESDGAGNARVKINGATLACSIAGLSLNLDAANVWTAQQSCQVSVLPDAATIAWNLAYGQVAKVTLGGNRTLGAPTNQMDGTYYSLRVVQDGTGGRSMAFNAAYKGVAGVVLSTAAGAVDHMVFRSNGAVMELTSFAKGVGV